MFLHLVLFGDIVSAEKLGQWIFICNSSLNNHDGCVLAIQRKNEEGQMWRSNFREPASCNSNLVECINSFPFPLDSWAYPSYQVGTPQIFIHDLRFNKMEQICYLTTFELFRDFLGGSAGKESCLQWGRPGFDPWVGKIPWRRETLPIPVFWPGEFHGLSGPWGSKSRTQLIDFHFTSLGQKNHRCLSRVGTCKLPWVSIIALERFVKSLVQENHRAVGMNVFIMSAIAS